MNNEITFHCLLNSGPCLIVKGYDTIHVSQVTLYSIVNVY